MNKDECETIRSFCGTCETVHEYIRSDSPQFKKQYANREELVEEILANKVIPHSRYTQEDSAFNDALRLAAKIVGTHALKEK